MSDVSSVTTASTVLETWLQEAQAYCEANGIDIDEINYVDDPQLLAYYQNAQLQLYELIYQTMYNSGDSDVGIGSSSEMPYTFEEYQAFFNDDIEKLVEDMLQNNPELVAYFAYQSGGQSEVDAFLSAISNLNTSTEGFTSTEQTQEFYDEHGLTESYGWVVDFQEASDASTNSLLQSISDDQLVIVELYSQLEGLDPSSPDYQAQLASLQSQSDMASATLEMKYTLLQQVTQQSANMFELISAMINKQMESLMAQVANLKSLA